MTFYFNHKMIKMLLKLNSETLLFYQIKIALGHNNKIKEVEVLINIKTYKKDILILLDKGKLLSHLNIN